MACGSSCEIRCADGAWERKGSAVRLLSPGSGRQHNYREYCGNWERPDVPPLRFCMITTFYPPHAFGGDALFVYGLTNMLARRGHEVDVIHCVDSYRALAKEPLLAEYPNEP